MVAELYDTMDGCNKNEEEFPKKSNRSSSTGQEKHVLQNNTIASVDYANSTTRNDSYISESKSQSSTMSRRNSSSHGDYDNSNIGANADAVATAAAAATLASLNDKYITRTIAASTNAKENLSSKDKNNEDEEVQLYKKTKKAAHEKQKEKVIRKRNREKKRRIDISSQFDTLTAMVKEFEKEDINSDISDSSSTSSNEDNNEAQPNKKSKKKGKKRKIHIPAGTISNRIDLMARTIAILETMHTVNMSLRHKTKEMYKSMRKMKRGSDSHQSTLQPMPNKFTNQMKPMSDLNTDTMESGKPRESVTVLPNMNSPTNIYNLIGGQMSNQFMNATMGMMLPFISNNHSSSINNSNNTNDVSQQARGPSSGTSTSQKNKVRRRLSESADDDTGGELLQKWTMASNLSLDIISQMMNQGPQGPREHQDKDQQELQQLVQNNEVSSQHRLRCDSLSSTSYPIPFHQDRDQNALNRSMHSILGIDSNMSNMLNNALFSVEDDQGTPRRSRKNSHQSRALDEDNQEEKREYEREPD